eukprot:jgi/Botrbrau1/23066/Bobra.0243s0007.1
MSFVQAKHVGAAREGQNLLESDHPPNSSEHDTQAAKHHFEVGFGTHFGKHPGSFHSPHTGGNRPADRSDNRHHAGSTNTVQGLSKEPHGVPEDSGTGLHTPRTPPAHVLNLYSEEDGRFDDPLGGERPLGDKPANGPSSFQASASAGEASSPTSSQVLEEREADPDMPLF